MNATNLISSFEKAHRLLFSLCVHDLMKPSGSSAQPLSKGIVQSKIAAVGLLRPLAIAAETCFVLVAIAVMVLWRLSILRGCELLCDPASLKDITDLIKDEPTSKTFNDQHIASFTTSRWTLREGQMHCKVEKQKPGSLEKQQQTRPQPRQQNGLNVTAELCSFQRPLEMSARVGLTFVLVLSSALIALIVVRSRIGKQQGLPLPSRSSSVNQICLNYIPVAFATFLEPFWTLLNRLLCILRPLSELLAGNASSSRSLDVRYTSLPPQLVFWRAFRSRHYLLAAVCAIGIAANVLAVSMNGLFEIHDSSHDVDIDIWSQPNDNFVGMSLTQNTDHLYMAQANFSGNVPLSPWTSREAYFLPFLKEEDVMPGTQTVKAKTTGIGATLKCQPVVLNTEAFVRGDTERFKITTKSASGRPITCGLDSGPLGGQSNSFAAAEVWRPAFTTSTDPEEINVCTHTIVAGFVRANLSLPRSEYKTDNNVVGGSTVEISAINSLEGLWLSCQSALTSAKYEVTVDPRGQIRSYVPVTPKVAMPETYFRNGTSPRDAMWFTNMLMYPGVKDSQPWWHNDTFVDTWFGYFVKTLSRSNSLIDPVQPPPDFSTVGPVVEDIYTRISAINLGLHPEWFSRSTSSMTVRGTASMPVRRVFMSWTMYFISTTLLGLNIMVAIIYYTRRPGPFLRYMPDSIAHILSLFEASSLIQEEKNGEAWQKHFQFGYGKYIGTDGRPHLGIERKPFIIPWNDLESRRAT